MKKFFGQIRRSARCRNAHNGHQAVNQTANQVIHEQNNDTEQTQHQQRLPVYRQAIFRICQLQLKICSKLLEIAPNKPLRRSPRTLKFLAGSTILRPYRSIDSQGRYRAIERLQGKLPKSLINYLHSQ